MKLPRAEKNNLKYDGAMLRRIYILVKRKDSRYNVVYNDERGSIMRKISKHTALLPHQAKQEKTNALSIVAPKGIAGAPRCRR